jgi:hypothetical protein
MIAAAEFAALIVYAALVAAVRLDARSDTVALSRADAAPAAFVLVGLRRRAVVVYAAQWVAAASLAAVQAFDDPDPWFAAAWGTWVVFGIVAQSLALRQWRRFRDATDGLRDLDVARRAAHDATSIRLLQRQLTVETGADPVADDVVVELRDVGTGRTETEGGDSETGGGT